MSPLWVIITFYHLIQKPKFHGHFSSIDWQQMYSSMEDSCIPECKQTENRLTELFFTEKYDFNEYVHKHCDQKIKQVMLLFVGVLILM